MEYAVTSSRADITPEPGENPYLAGYGVTSGLRVVVGNAPYGEPLMARCLVLWESGRPHALISVDLLGIPRQMNLALRERVLPLASWTTSSIVVLATHSHNTPAVVDVLHPYITYGLSELEAVKRYSARVVSVLTDLVQQALAQPPTPVTLDFGVEQVSVAYNRAGLATVESDVPVLVARDSAGRPRAVLWGYGCHPVSAGWQEVWDGDWPSGACQRLESIYVDCTAMFALGAAGDQDPVYPRSWVQRDAHAEVLAEAVARAVDSGGRPISGPLRTTYSEAQLPLEVPASMPTARTGYEARLANPSGQPRWYQRHAGIAIARIDTGATRTHVLAPVQGWTFMTDQPLRLAFIAGEPVSAYAQWTRGQFGGSAGVMVGGCANDYCGYLPDLQFLPGGVFQDGSYEGGWDPDFPGLAGGSATIFNLPFRMSHSAPYVLLDAIRAQLA